MVAVKFTTKQRPSRAFLILLATTLLTMLSYAPFSHDERHLLILYPLLTMEIWKLLHVRLTEFFPQRPVFSWILIPLGLLVLLYWPARLEGFLKVDPNGQKMIDTRPAQLSRIATMPAGPLLVDNAALLWYSYRSGIWIQESHDMEMELRALMPDLAQESFVQETNRSIDIQSK